MIFSCDKIGRLDATAKRGASPMETPIIKARE